MDKNESEKSRYLAKNKYGILIEHVNSSRVSREYDHLRFVIPWIFLKKWNASLKIFANMSPILTRKPCPVIVNAPILV